MVHQRNESSPWATNVQADASRHVADDSKAMSVNFAQCQAARGRLFPLLSAAEALNRALVPRFFTVVTTAFLFLSAVTLLA